MKILGRAGLLAAVILLAAGAAGAQVYEKSVLALYKSSEGQTPSENEVQFYLAKPLKEMGLDLVFWDIDRGIPGESVTRYSRAIVSWFRGPSMAMPEKYLEFLDRMMDSGRKVLVFDNFGAYQNRATQEFLQPLRLNATLEKLGILYQGDWTENSELIRIADKDARVTEYQAGQDAGQSKFYYRYMLVDRDASVFLSLRRTDRPQGPSPVILANRNGGFALSRYIYRMEQGRVRLLLNPAEFLKAALFPAPKRQNFALISNPSDKTGARIQEFSESVLKRSKIPFTLILPRQTRGMVPLDLRPFSAVGLILDSDSGLDPRLLETYLAGGGRLVSLRAGTFKSLAPHLAIKANRDKRQEAIGYRLNDTFAFAGKAGLENRRYTWQAGTAVPADGATLLGTDNRERTPLVWTAQVGNGRVLVWNWDELQSGELMGFIVESFLSVLPLAAAATPGLSIMYIDDWPNPMYNVVKPPLDSTDTEFYTKRWWPDIKRIFSNWNIPFSSYLIFNYNAVTAPPFPTGEFFVSDASISLAREILTAGWELGLHGYNHMSLSRGSSSRNANTWPSAEVMEEVLGKARDEWIRLFGEHSLPRSYVAPHNVISEEGLAALLKVFPTIKAVSTLRAGSGDESFFEFGPHPKFPSVYMMPRTTAGFHFTPDTRAMMVSGILGPGLWSHFIHSDDVFDPARSLDKSWEAMRADFEAMIRYAAENYPWLRRTDSYEGYLAMRRYDETGISFSADGARLVIECSQPGTLVRVRFPGAGLKRITGGSLVHRAAGLNAAVIRVDGPRVEAEFQ